jgi:hypothetical protein
LTAHIHMAGVMKERVGRGELKLARCESGAPAAAIIQPLQPSRLLERLSLLLRYFHLSCSVIINGRGLDSA